MKKYTELECPGIGKNTIKVDITKDSVEKEYWRVPQTRIYWLFRQYFRAANPGGQVFTESEYLNTSMPGMDAINTTLKALSEFKNWHSRGGKGAARKPDVMGISADGLRLELLEITTAAQEDEKQAGSRQLREKLDVLNSRLLKEASKKNIVAVASRWEPNQNDPYQKFHIYPEKSVFCCFNPTYDPSVPTD